MAIAIAATTIIAYAVSRASFIGLVCVDAEAVCCAFEKAVQRVKLTIGPSEGVSRALYGMRIGKSDRQKVLHALRNSILEPLPEMRRRKPSLIQVLWRLRRHPD